jgi:hypothetical protein
MDWHCHYTVQTDKRIMKDTTTVLSVQPTQNFIPILSSVCGPGSSVGIATGLSGDRIQVVARFSAPVQTGFGAQPAPCTMGTRSFPGVKSGRGVMLTPHSLLVPWSWKSRAIPLLPLWAVRPVQSLSACTRAQCLVFPLFCPSSVHHTRVSLPCKIFIQSTLLQYKH